MLPPQLRDPMAAMPGMGNPNRRNPMAGENSVAEDRAGQVVGGQRQGLPDGTRQVRPVEDLRLQASPTAKHAPALHA